MEKTELVIQNKAGIHVRVASLLVQTANDFKSEIYIYKDNEKANCKSIMGIMMLGITYGTNITLSAEGEDEKQAIESLSQLIEDKFDKKNQ